MSQQRLFPHIQPLTNDEAAARMAGAVWGDIRDTHYGPALLHKHHTPVHDRPAYCFPYQDRAYLLHRNQGSDTWAVTLYAAPSATNPAATVDEIGMLVTGKRTQEDAVTQLVQDLYGTTDDHGYHRGRDSCPSCDYFQESVYPNLP